MRLNIPVALNLHWSVWWSFAFLHFVLQEIVGLAVALPTAVTKECHPGKRGDPQ